MKRLILYIMVESFTAFLLYKDDVILRLNSTSIEESTQATEQIIKFISITREMHQNCISLLREQIM